MPTTSPADFLELLRGSDLLPPAQLEEVVPLLAQAARPEQLAQLLVRRGWLTPYQSQQLLAGDGRGLTIGPYRVLDLIGEGGMGQVFKAVHARLQRVVALKVIHPGRMAHDPEAVRRFQREARAAALMAHPNVVMLYDADEVDDTYFIALEYVEGTDLAKLVKDGGPLDVWQACEYVRQAALGLQHAHEHGMVHRDIKPSNLLVTRRARPGGPDEAVVKILDMGLVRMVESAEGGSCQASLTQEGTVVGTPDYIAPEQARNAHRVDIRADLYSLGCTFYHLLAGRPPFPEGTVIEKLLMHQLDEPKGLEAVRPEAPPGVVMVVRKLMAKRREDRYQTPAEAAAALAGVLPARRAADPAWPGPVPAARQPGPSEPTPAPRGSLPTDEVKTVRVSGIIPTTPAPPSRDTPAGPAGPQLLAVLKGHSGCVLAAAFGPDRDTLACGGVDGFIRLWDFSGGKPRERAALATHRPPAPRAPGRTMLRVGEPSLSAFVGGGVHSLAFSPDRRLLASGSGGMDGRVRLWDLSAETPPEVAALAGHRSPVEGLAFAPDGKALASVGADGAVRLWDLTTVSPRERAVLRGHTDVVKAVAFAPDGERVASGGQDGAVRLWKAAGRLWAREQVVFTGHGGHVNSLAFAPDGKTLASASQDQTVRLWNLGGGTSGVLEGHSSVVRLVLFTPGGDSLISLDDGGRAVQWDLATKAQVRDWTMPRSGMCGVALTFDGRYLAAGTTDGNVRVFRLGEKRRSGEVSMSRARAG